MSDTRRQRIALLLIAVMALLPLQAVHAAWMAQGAGDHCAHGASADTGHQSGHIQGQQGDCCASQAAADDPTGGHSCNGSCELCCGIAATLPGAATTILASLSDSPERTELATATVQRHSPLLRPPSDLR